ncbi:FAD-dependent oxidoreductase, partial [Nocardioides pelophilus]|uniref:FAD-dependent oxidoreductase n=1 Tax=Nocardioides pelophilus TaxID=2172019 RepID=UPI0016041B8C
LERAFRRRGITSRTGTSVTGVTTTDEGDGAVVVTLSDDTELRADVLLVAVGRAPRTEGLGYEEQGVTLDRGYVTTDDRCRTGVDGIWAVGDIVPGLQLAHRGFQQGIFVAEQIAGLAPQSIDERGIPRVTYSRPEVASVGLTEEQANEQYGAESISTLTYDLAGNGKSQILRTQGFVKLIRQADGPVVGVHLVGERVGELIGEAQLVYGWEAHPDDVAPLVHAHPTQNEAIGEAFLALAGKPLHAHS